MLFCNNRKQVVNPIKKTVSIRGLTGMMTINDNDWRVCVLDGCMFHLTAVAATALSSYLRYSLHLKYAPDKLNTDLINDHKHYLEAVEVLKLKPRSRISYSIYKNHYIIFVVVNVIFFILFFYRKKLFICRTSRKYTCWWWLFIYSVFVCFGVVKVLQLSFFGFVIV